MVPILTAINALVILLPIRVAKDMPSVPVLIDERGVRSSGIAETNPTTTTPITDPDTGRHHKFTYRRIKIRLAETA